MAARIEPQLKEHGCDMSPNQFRQYVDEMFAEHVTDYTLDEMLLHPREAISFCDTVRQSGREFADLPDHLILRSVIGQRKKGKGTKR
jgi:hypothetical protein